VEGGEKILRVSSSGRRPEDRALGIQNAGTGTRGGEMDVIGEDLGGAGRETGVAVARRGLACEVPEGNNRRIDRYGREVGRRNNGGRG
jgi:hypothetical protein